MEFTEMTDSPPPQTGDLIRLRLPVFTSPRIPGDEERLCLVMALEVDEDKNKIEGYWVIRLSERLNVKRSWDYYLSKKEIGQIKDKQAYCDHVIRTSRIDLIPATPEYVGGGEYLNSARIQGRVMPHFWDSFLPKLHDGQESPFDRQAYGPREKLPHTVVKTSLHTEDSMADFDYESVVAMVSLPKICENTPERKQSCFAANFEKAEAQLRSQWVTLRRMIHADFVAAGQPKEGLRTNTPQGVQPLQPF